MTAPVVMCPVRSGKRILLIRKPSSMFGNYWRVPSGRVGEGENMPVAAQRVLLDETGLSSAYVSLSGVISQDVCGHKFVINVCQMKVKLESLAPVHGTEAAWVKLADLGGMKDLLPSDRQIIKRLVQDEESRYFQSKLSKKNGQWELESFEQI
jgi:ADP-ribose pyrophosphatase YjhB (NUDIX family)